MVLKLTLVVLVLLALVAFATIAAYKYFDNEAERQHEKELKELENQEKLFENDDL